MVFKKYLDAKRRKNSAEIEEVTLAVAHDEDETLAIRSPLPSTGFRLLKFLAVVVFGLLAFRVFQLQVLKGDYYAHLARENRIRYVEIKAPRGLIRDRNGESLVNNAPSFDAVMVPADLPADEQERTDVLAKAASVLGMNDENLKTIADLQDRASSKPVLVKENIGEDQTLVFSERKSELRGFCLEKTAVRDYEDGSIFSAVMGYTGKITSEELKKFPDYQMTDYVGKAGLELTYEKNLHGVNGKHKVEVDSVGNVKKDLGADNPTKGDDLELGLDAGLQKKIAESLEKTFEASKSKTAAAIALDPQSGEVLALVSLPGFDNNLFAKGISAEDYQGLISDPAKPMFNRAISGEYPPGSTLKPLIAAAALEEKTINAGTTVDCHGGIRIGNYNFPDWKTHGATDIRKAIAESCDVFFYSVGGGGEGISGLGIDKMKKYANLFGLGRPLGIDISSEAGGLFPDGSWKEKRFGERWYVGDNYHAAIGQGFITATPLQLANLAATVANGGTVYRPHLVRKIKRSNGAEEQISPETLNRRIVSSSSLEIVREGMRQTVSSEQGSARQLNDLPVTAAGKTGTAQFGSEGRTHGWFISFAPFENPRIAMAVLVEGGGEGHSTAVPVTKEVYEWYFAERNTE